jgi:predicted amidohydrolase YtcJ
VAGLLGSRRARAQPIAIGLVLAAFGPACAHGPRGPDGAVAREADLILRGAAVYTLDGAHPWAEAIAIEGSEIVAVGSRQDVAALQGPGTRVVDLGGKMVLPGFHDTHVHPVTGGVELSQCDLNGLDSAQAVAAKVRACAEARPDDDWIVGGGWDLPLYEGANPSRLALDAIVGDRPAYLASADAHSAWVSTAALRRANVTAATPDPPGGHIERDAAGEPTGTLRETAMQLVETELPALTPADRVAGLCRGLQMAAGFGITSLVEASADAEVLAAYETLAAADALTARVLVASTVDAARGPEQIEELAARRDAIDRLDHPRLSATQVKIFADGVIEAGTAALLEPYVGTRERGEPRFSPESMRSITTAADRQGLDVHVHAIGDRAIRITLDAIEAAARDNPPRDRRHVIAHVQLVDPVDLPRFAALGVTASVQPLWAYPDAYITDLTIPVLGQARSRWLYPIGSLLRSGARVAAGSDWSVSSMNPLHGIEVAITRRAIDDPKAPPGPWIPEEVATLSQMLAAYTTAGAWLMRHEDEVGTLAPGMRADLVVLNRNLFTLPPAAIHDARIVLTVIDGEPVHDPDGMLGGARPQGPCAR